MAGVTGSKLSCYLKNGVLGVIGGLAPCLALTCAAELGSDETASSFASFKHSGEANMSSPLSWASSTWLLSAFV